jgi:hypothetical protein
LGQAQHVAGFYWVMDQNHPLLVIAFIYAFLSLVSSLMQNKIQKQIHINILIFTIVVNYSTISISSTHFYSECKKGWPVYERLIILTTTFDCSIGINSLPILGHIVNEKSKEIWLRIVVFTVELMPTWYSSRSYPGMISLFHFTKSSHRSWRITSSILFTCRRNCILFNYQFSYNNVTSITRHRPGK